MNVNAVTGADSTQAAVAENVINTPAAGFSNYMSQASLSYGDYLEQIFERASNTYHVSKDLLKAMAKAESDFDASATSHCGAMGIMQLMPQTAASLGVTDAYDPEQNIMGGAQYISRLLEKYNNNLSYAVAAYNAGGGNVDKYGGIPPFKETQGYVAKVLRYLDEGVTIPNSSGTVGTSSSMQTASLSGAGQNFAASGTGQTAISSRAASFIEEILDHYFDYDDYLEFLQLFTKIISEKLAGTDLAAEESEQTGEETKNEQQKTQQEVSQVQPVKILTMKVRGADGTVSTYQQEESENEDAIRAYQYMTAGGQNRMKIFMNKA